MGKSKLNSLVDRILWNAKKIRSNAFNINLSLSRNEIVVAKLNGTADGIEMVVNAIKREIVA